MNMQFANAWVLYLLWLVPLLGAAWYALYRRRQRAMGAFLSEEMHSKLAPPLQTPRFAWQMVLCLAGLLLILLAAARPQWGTGEEVVYQRSRDLVIALDVSRSMLAQDVRPNRLERAKLDILDLVRELRGDRVALIAFRGKAIPICPLTTDYAFLRQALDAADIGSAPRGETDIGDAILKALDAFQSDAGAHKAIVLVSDGEDLSRRATGAAEEAKKRGVPVFTVGLGSAQGARVPSPVEGEKYLSYQGTEVLSKLENETLRKIAEITGGAYVPVGMANVRLGTLYRNHLSRLAAQDTKETLLRRYIERYQSFLLPSLLCLLGAAFLSRGRLAAVSARRDLSEPARTRPGREETPPGR